jgi:hypothetical protein
VTQIIIINGINRGGTNLLWNLLRSIHGASTLTLTCQGCTQPVEVGEYFQVKQENDFKEFIRDTRILVLKGVGDDIQYNPMIRRYSSIVVEIGLIKNRFAACESWVRRGSTVQNFVEKYNKFINDLKANNNVILDFTSVVTQPFHVVNKVCDIIQEPHVQSVSIKSKNIWKNDGSYGAAFGNANDRTTLNTGDLLNDFINPHVDAHHEKNLHLHCKQYVHSHCKDHAKEFKDTQYLFNQ